MPRTATDLRDYLSDPATTLPEPLALDEMAARLVRLHHQNGGATFNPYFGDMSGQRLYAVALYPERSATLPGQSLSAADLHAYVQANQHLLQDARNNVGTWYNRDMDETYLDVSTTVADRDEAVAIAARYNQIAIYDLAGRLEIETGGTGEAAGGLPPVGERLPKLIRDEQGKNNE